MEGEKVVTSCSEKEEVMQLIKTHGVAFLAQVIMSEEISFSWPNNAPTPVHQRHQVFLNPSSLSRQTGQINRALLRPVSQRTRQCQNVKAVLIRLGRIPIQYVRQGV